MNILTYKLIEVEENLNGINKIVKNKYEVNINNKKTINFDLIVKVNDFDVRSDRDYIEKNIALILIDSFCTAKEFNNFNNIEDIKEFIFEFGYECNEGLDVIKDLKEIFNILELDLTEEEFKLCRYFYNEGGEKEFEKIKNIINRNFKFNGLK